MKRILGLSIGLFSFLVSFSPVRALTLSDINSALGLTVIYGGTESNLDITSPQTGVYVIKAKAFSCNIPDAGCDPDRYEVRLPKFVTHVFGLGMQPSVNQVELNDFLDKDFSVGHCYAVRTDPNDSTKTIVMEDYGSDCRMRTPVFSLPGENLMVAYLQPAVKMLRLTRDGQYSCPAGSTCLALKKHPTYNDPGDVPAPLVLVKGINLAATYTAYNALLRGQGFYFKNPQFQAFGPTWETYFEFGCNATKDDILTGHPELGIIGVLPYFASKNVQLSVATIGSGYWNTANAAGCSDANDANFPVMDTLAIHTSRFGGLTGMQDYYQQVEAQGIYPLIGMRHRVQLGTVQLSQPTPAPTPNAQNCLTSVTPCDNLARVGYKFAEIGYTGTNGVSGYNFKNFLLSLDPNNILTALKDIPEWGDPAHYYIDTSNPTTIDKWIQLLKNNYGSFKGIKLDDMDIMDQKVLSGTVTAPNYATPNFPDNIDNPIFPRYLTAFNNDFLIFSRNDWFGYGSDATEFDWLGESRQSMAEPTSYTGNTQKFYLETGLTQIMSGYPHPKSFYHSGGPNGSGLSNGPPGNDFHNETGKHITNEILKTTFVRESQLDVFFAVTSISRLPNHLRFIDGTIDTTKENVLIWYEQLRQRLRQYAFDQAQKWYRTGVPQLMQPLMFRFGDDDHIWDQYTYLSAADDHLNPKDEFMFGNALLVRPVFNNASTQKTYFPAGSWLPFIGQTGVNLGQTYTQGYTDYPFPDLADTAHNLDYPVFLKDGEILIIGDMANPDNLSAYVALSTTNTSAVYELTKKTGEIYQLKALKDGSGNVTIQNVGSGTSIPATFNTSKKFYTANIMTLLTNPPPPTITNTPSPTINPILTLLDFDHDGNLDFLDFNHLVVSYKIPSDLFNLNKLSQNFGLH